MSSRDPRLNARRGDGRLQQQAAATPNEDSRKRSASLSPASTEQPSQKVLKPGADNFSRLLSTFGNESRPSGSKEHSPVSSRRSSTHTNAGNCAAQATQLRGTPTRRPAMANSIANTNAATNLDARLSRKRKDVLAAWIASNNHAAELASVRTAHSQAKVQKDRATEVFNAMSPNFKDFPAMKEMHTEAKKKADESFQAWDEKLKRLEDAQIDMINNAIESLLPVAETPAAELVKGDYIARAECDEIVSRAVAQCKKQVLETTDAYRAKVVTLEDQVKSSSRSARDLEPSAELMRRIDALENAAKLAPESTSQERKLDIVGRLVSIESTVKDSDARHKSRLQALEDKICHKEEIDLVKRVETLEEKANQPGADLGNRIHALENSVKEAAKNHRQLSETKLLKDIEAIQERLSSNETTVDNQFEVVSQYVDEKLKDDHKLLNDKLNEGYGKVNKELQAFRVMAEALRESVNEGNRKQHLDAQAIISFVNRLDQIEADARRFATIDGLAALESSVAELGTTEKPRSTKSNDLMPFQPIVPDNIEEENLPRLRQIEAQILALQMVAEQHGRVLDNTTTDQLALQMLDQLSAHFPFAQDFPRTINALHAKIQTIDQQIKNVEVNLTAKDFDSLRSDLSNIASQVTQHEDLAVRGKEQAESFDADVKSLRREVETLKSYTSTAFASLAKRVRATDEGE